MMKSHRNVVRTVSGVLLTIGMGVFGAVACTVSTSPQEHNDDCVGDAPDCSSECGPEVTAACVDGDWVCPDVAAGDCAACPGDPPECRDQECGVDGEVSCVEGQWVCEIPAIDCAVCEGEAPECLESCGSDNALGVAFCDVGTWACVDGVLLDSDACNDLCEGPAPTCVDSCEAHNGLGSATCVDGDWTCEDGVPLDECNASCKGEAPPCLLECDIVVGDAQCVDGSWACSEGDLPEDSKCTCADFDLGACECTGEAPQCVDSCETGNPTGSAQCLGADIWNCESGVPVYECQPRCGDDVPGCVDACESGIDVTPVCGEDGSWACPADSVPSAQCPMP